MPVYRYGGDIYDIPEEKVSAFEKKYPDAVVSFSKDGEIYDIPVSKKSQFLKQFPNATLYTDEAPAAPVVQEPAKKQTWREKRQEKKQQRQERAVQADTLLTAAAADSEVAAENEIPAREIGKDYENLLVDSAKLEKDVNDFNKRWKSLEDQTKALQSGNLQFTTQEEVDQFNERIAKYNKESERLKSLQNMVGKNREAILSSPEGQEFKQLSDQIASLGKADQTPENKWALAQAQARMLSNPITIAAMGDKAPSADEVAFGLNRSEAEYINSMIEAGVDRQTKKKLKARLKELSAEVLDNEYYQSDVAKRLGETDKELDETLREIADLRQKVVKEKSALESTEDALLAYPEYNNLVLAANQLRNQKRKLEHIRDKNAGDFWVNFMDVFADPNTYNFGITNLNTALATAGAMKNQNIPGAKELLDAVAGSNATDAEENQFVTSKGRWGAIAANSIPFMVSIGLTGGFGNVAKAVGTGTGKLASRIAGKEVANNLLVRATGAVLGDLAAGFVSANTIGGAKTLTDFLNSYYGTLQKDENGNYNYEGGTGNVLKSGWKSEVGNVMEYASERAGDHLQHILGRKLLGAEVNAVRSGKKAAVSPWKEALAKGLDVTLKDFGFRGSNALEANAAMKAFSKFIDISNRVGIQGYPFEAIEEYVGLLGNILLGGEEDWMDFSKLGDKDTHADIWGGMLYSIGLTQSFGVAAGAAGTAAAGIRKAKTLKQIESSLNDASAEAMNLIGEETWGAIKEKIDASTNPELTKFISETMDSSDYSDEEKAAILDYAKDSFIYRGFNAGTISQARERLTSEEDLPSLSISAEIANASDQISNAYMLGYTSGEKSDENEDRVELEAAVARQKERLSTVTGIQDMTTEQANALLEDESASREVKDAALDYLMAVGVEQGFADAERNKQTRIKANMFRRFERDLGGKFYYTDEATGERVVQLSFMTGSNGEDIPVYLLSDTPDSKGLVPYRDNNGKFGMISRDKIHGADGTVGATEKMTLNQFMDGQYQLYEERMAALDAQEDQAVADAENAQLLGTMVGQTVFVSGNGAYEPMRIERTTNNGQSVVISGDKEALKGVAAAAGIPFPGGSMLEIPTNALYPLLAKNDDGSISTQEAAAPQGADTEGAGMMLDGRPIGNVQIDEEAGSATFNYADDPNGVLHEMDLDEFRQKTGAAAQEEAPEGAAPAEAEAPQPAAEPETQSALPMKNGEVDWDNMFNVPAEEFAKRLPELVELMRSLYGEKAADYAMSWYSAEKKKLDGIKEMTGDPKKDAQNAKKRAESQVLVDNYSALTQALQASKEAAAAPAAQHKSNEDAVSLATGGKFHIGDTVSFPDADSFDGRSNGIVVGLDEERKGNVILGDGAGNKITEKISDLKLVTRGQNEADVPDVSDDTPEAAQQRGYIMQNGNRIDRSAEDAIAHEGADTKIAFTKNEAVDGKYGLVEADRIVPSHISDQENPLHFFAKKWQPKNRKKADSATAIQQMANGIRPGEITRGETAYGGAPIVNARGEVIQGNGRSEALRRAYQQGTAAQYKEWLAEHAEEFGLTREQVESMKNPVLVRALNVDDARAEELGKKEQKDLESGGDQTFSGKTLAKKIGDRLGEFADILFAGDLGDDATLNDYINTNGDVALKWLRRNGFINDTEYQNALEKDRSGGFKFTDATVAAFRELSLEPLFAGASEKVREGYEKLPNIVKLALQRSVAMLSKLDGVIPDIQDALAYYFDFETGDPAFRGAKDELSAKNALLDWMNNLRLENGKSEAELHPNLPARYMAAWFKGAKTIKSVTDRFRFIAETMRGEGGFMAAAEPTDRIGAYQQAGLISEEEANNLRNDGHDAEVPGVPESNPPASTGGRQGSAGVDSVGGGNGAGSEGDSGAAPEGTGSGAVAGGTQAEEAAERSGVSQHPANLRAAYESGNAEQIAAAEKAVAEFINKSDSIALLRGTESIAKKRRKEAKKDSPEYKLQDFILKTTKTRIGQLDKAEVKAYDDARAVYEDRFTAEKNDLESAIAYFQGELETAQALLNNVPEEADDLYVSNLKSRVSSANRYLEVLKQELNRFEEEEEETEPEANEDLDSDVKEPKKPAQKSAKNTTDAKIEDFGEKIGGARKDLYRSRIRDSVKLTKKDLKELKDPDKILSRKQIITLVEKGEMTNADAQTMLAMNMAVRALSDSFGMKTLGLAKYRDMAAAWERGEDLSFGISEEDVDFMEGNYSEGQRSMPNFREKTRLSLERLFGKVFDDYKATYEAIDYPAVNRSIRSTYIRPGMADGRFWVVSGPNSYRGWPYATMEQAAAKMKSEYPEIKKDDSKNEKPEGEQGDKIGNLTVVKDDYGWYRVKSRSIPGKIYLSKKFSTKKLAEQFLKENAVILADREQKMVDALLGSNIGMVMRQGRDYRNGKDVTPDQMLDTFGFRGVEFGNWVPQAERQEYLNKTYDAIMDFCDIVGISPKAFSLGGRLGIAFGSRGHSRALAHYEPMKEVINLTRMKGAGSLAHEWFHALDNYLSKQKTGNISDMATSTKDTVREATAKAFRDFVDAMDKLDYSKRSYRAGDYWGEVWERAARLFESYVYNELASKNVVSPLLVRKDSLFDDAISDENVISAWPYPSIAENEQIKPFFDNLFNTIEEKVDENGVVVLASDRGRYVIPESEVPYYYEYQERLNNAGSDEEKRAAVLQEYYRKVQSEDYPVDVIPASQAEEYILRQNLPERPQKDALTYMDWASGLDFGDHAVVFSDSSRIPSIATAWAVYVHERQHMDTAKNPNTIPAVREAYGNTEDVDDGYVRMKQTIIRFGASFNYLTMPAESLASEIMSRAIEVAYGEENYEDILKNEYLVPEKVIQLVKDSYEQRNNFQHSDNLGREAGLDDAEPGGRKEDGGNGQEVSRKDAAGTSGRNGEGEAGQESVILPSDFYFAPFYSNAGKALESIKAEKATPQQWLAMLEKAGGIKAGEDKWIGLSDWLKASDKKTITKQEIQDYIDQNRIRIEEAHYAEDAEKSYAGAIESYQNEYAELVEEGKQKGERNPYVYAYAEMGERYGDDFDMAFERDGETITPSMDYYGEEFSEAAEYFLDQRRDDISVKGINQTRLGYTTEGLENKHEIALTVPSIEPWSESDNVHFGDAGEGRAIAWIRFGDTMTEKGKGNAPIDVKYVGPEPIDEPHRRAIEGMILNWKDTENVMRNTPKGDQFLSAKSMFENNLRDNYYEGSDEVRTRRAQTLGALNDIEEGDFEPVYEGGKKVLFIDEIQSKRHQEAREKGGYKNPELQAKAERRGELSRKFYSEEGVSLEEKKEYDALQQELYEIGEKEVVDNAGRPSAAPFEKNWHELAMKRMLRYAAENGYDYVAWTTGDQQAERYNIGNMVQDIEKRDGKVYIDLDDGSAITLKVNKEGKILESTGAHIESGEYNERNLSDIVGKEVAEKIMQSQDGVLRGDDLRIGGEGMKGFYDEILPRFMNKYGKKWGVKVEDMTLPIGYSENTVAHSVPVTDSMKESVMQGQPMFREETDADVLERLDSEPTITAYRAMQFVPDPNGDWEFDLGDGNGMQKGFLYPPMSAKVDGKWRNPVQKDKWERSVEDPSRVSDEGPHKNQFYLDRGDEGGVWAAYNPYFHSSDSMLNDQFKKAQSRDNLVVVEVMVPEREVSESNMNPYRAEKAKDAVGKHEWKAGTVQGQLTGTRNVYLSRWDKPHRIVPVDEVARNVEQQIRGQVAEMPSNVVWPQLRAELEKLGVNFVETDNKGIITEGERKGQSYESMYSAKNRLSKQEQKELEKQRKKERAERADSHRRIIEAERMATNKALDTLSEQLGITIYRVPRSAMPAGHKTAKGYYNPRTGEMTICMDNVMDERDAIATVFHETVGHHGLRKLFGPYFNEAMVNIYAALDARGRALVNAYMKRHNLQPGNEGIIIGMEEYLSHLAESGNFKKTVWERIKEIFGRIVDKLLGIEGFTFTDNELNYILRASYENLTNPGWLDTMQGKAVDTLMKRALGINETNPSLPTDPESSEAGLRFRDGNTGVASDDYNAVMEQKRTAIVMQNQNADLPVKIGMEKAVQEWEKKHPGKTFDKYEDEDYLTRHNLASSRAATEAHNFELFRFAPLLDQVRTIQSKLIGDKVTKDEREDAYSRILDYMYAVSGLERNRYKNNEIEKAKQDALNGVTDPAIIAQIEKRFEDMKKDWSGLTSLMGLDASQWQLAESRAQAMVDSFRTEVGDDAALDELWNRARACTDFSLEHAYKYGLLTREEYERLHGTASQPRMWDYYLPLRGFAKETAEERFSYSNFTNPSSGDVVVKKMKGRWTEADNPLANILNIAENEIVEGNDNWAKQALLKFTRHLGANSLLTEVRPWYEKNSSTGKWMPAEPLAVDPATGNPETLESFEKRMQAKKANGEAKIGRNGLKLDNIMANKAHRNEHLIRLKVDGMEKMIWVHGNPALAKAVSGIGRADNLQWFRRASRALSNLFTTYSLDFTAKNLIRDTIYSRVALMVKEDKAYRHQFSKNWWANLGYGAFAFPMAKLTADWNSGKLQAKDPADRTKREQMFIDFMTDGGQTGYTIINSVNEIKRDLERQMRRAGGKPGTIPVLGWYAKAVKTLNEAFELLTRFTAYETSRDMGRSGQRSASDAKEISVNFNRRGAQSGGDIWGNIAAYLGATHYFYNAGVQGFDNFLHLFKKSPVKMSVATGGLVLMGVLTPLINGLLAGLFGGDDDDNEDWYWNLPEWVRRNNLILGTGEWYLAIPMPVEFRAPYGIGDIMGAAFCYEKYANRRGGIVPWGDLSFDIISTASGILPVNPVEGYTGNGNIGDAVIRAVAPDATMFFVDWATNRDYTGRPLWKENPFSDTTPRSQGAYASTPKGIVAACQKLAEVTAGGIDVAPGLVRDFLNNYGGGFYRAAEDVSKLLFTDEERPRRWDNVPFFSGFTGHIDEDRSNSFASNALYDYKKVSEGVVKDLNSVLNTSDVTTSIAYDTPDALYDMATSVVQKARVKKILDSKDYELGKMYREGMNNEYVMKQRASGAHAGEWYKSRELKQKGVDALKKEWKDLREQWAKMPSNTQEEKDAKEAFSLEVQEAWHRYYDAEADLAQRLLDYEYGKN